jgi:hypothetical protein
VLWNQNAAECAASMIRRYKSRHAAIEQAHANEIDADSAEQRAFWRAVLAKLRAYSANGPLDK